MTINGLNACVNKTCTRTTLSRLRSYFGITVLIVDAYGWLHAAKHITGVVELLSCNLPCPPLYAFVERRVSALSMGGKFKVILVFDGLSVNKGDTENTRQQVRLQQRKDGLAAQADGDYAKATPLLRAAVDITPDVAKQVVDYLNELSHDRKRRIGLQRCVVSINEADPLCCYLNRQIKNSCVVSNDYDVVAWGATACCFKVNYFSGEIHLFNRDVFNVSAVVSRRLLVVTHQQLIDICVLAGCDYCKNLKGEGFVRAVNNIRQYGTCYICICEHV